MKNKEQIKIIVKEVIDEEQRKKDEEQRKKEKQKQKIEYARAEKKAKAKTRFYIGLFYAIFFLGYFFYFGISGNFNYIAGILTGILMYFSFWSFNIILESIYKEIEKEYKIEDE